MEINSTQLNLDLNNIREESLPAQAQAEEDRRLDLEIRQLEIARHREERRRALEVHRAEILKDLEAQRLRLDTEREERVRLERDQRELRAQQDEMRLRLERIEDSRARVPVEVPAPTNYAEPLDLSPPS